MSVPALAGFLAADHEVTLVTSSQHAGALPPAAPGVRRVAASEPDHVVGGFACPHHAYSAAVLTAIEAAYGDGPGPDLLEAPDFTAESFVALQAARTGHELLARTRFVVRLRGTLEVALLHNDVWPRDEQEELLAVYAMERELLARADRLVHAGGDTLAACARYYGEHALAPATRVRLPLPALARPAPFVPRAPGAPLRLLYAGRLERRKGVLELAEAILRLPSASVRLTLVGADTTSAPLGRSMRSTIETMAGGDDRIELHDARPRAELHALMAEHDVVVLPSRFEWWANVAVEAMHAGVPVLATPVGGFTEQILHGETGWLTEGTGPRALSEAIARLADDPAAVDAMRASGAPQRHLARLTDPGEISSGYDELLAAPLRRRSAPLPAAMPRITAVIPAHDAGDMIADAVDSFFDQAGDSGDVIVVEGGSGPASIEALDRLRRKPRVTVLHQRQGGPAAARNLGVETAEGDYVLLLDADDVLERGYLHRTLSALACDPGLSYATTWVRMEYADGIADPTRLTAWCPLGAGAGVIESRNVVGGPCTLFPRRVFSELGYRYTEANPLNDDRELLQQLWRDGLPGAVVPAQLMSMQRLATGITAMYAEHHRHVALVEMRARLRTRETRWTAQPA